MGSKGSFSHATPAINFLTNAGVEFETLAFERTAETGSYGKDAAAALGLDERSVFKTLVVALDGDGLGVCVVPVSAQANLKAVASALGAKRAELAPPAVVQRKTGYVLGGVSPFGMKVALPTVIDSSAQALDVIYVSGGRRGLDVAIGPQGAARLISAAFADIARHENA